MIETTQLGESGFHLKTAIYHLLLLEKDYDITK